MNQTQQRQNNQQETGNQKDLQANTKEQNDLATKNSYSDNTEKPEDQKSKKD